MSISSKAVNNYNNYLIFYEYLLLLTINALEYQVGGYFGIKYRVPWKLVWRKESSLLATAPTHIHLLNIATLVDLIQVVK